MLARRRRGGACAAVCLIAGMIAGGVSNAAEWSMESSVSMRNEYNDNIELTSAPHPTVWGVLVAPEIKFSGETERLKVTGGARLSFNRYFGASGLDSTDHAVTLRSTYKAERDIFGLDADFIEDSTLVSELLETGIVQARRQRDRSTANPSWRHDITESVAITASYGYTAVRYADTHNTSLINYSDQQLTLGALWQLSERDTLTTIAYYDWYKTDPKTFEAKTYGIQAKYDHAFSETFRGTLAVGARNTRSTQSSQALVCNGEILFGLCFGTVEQATFVATDQSTGYTFFGSFDKKYETSLISGQLSREIYPTGVGALVETDRLGFAWQRDLSPTLTFFVDASIYNSRYIGNFVGGSDSRYYRIEPRLTWRITDEWTLLSGYSYGRVRYENGSASASANVAYLVISYTWPKMSVSR